MNSFVLGRRLKYRIRWCRIYNENNDINETYLRMYERSELLMIEFDNMCTKVNEELRPCRCDCRNCEYDLVERDFDLIRSF